MFPSSPAESHRLMTVNSSLCYRCLTNSFGTRELTPFSGDKMLSAISVEIAPGKLIDRITILEIKLEHMDDPDKLKNVGADLETLAEARDGAIALSPQLDKVTAELKKINIRIWRIEDNIRECEWARDFGPAFIKLARAVYFSNDKRAALKRGINELLGSRPIEEKSYAA
jgi:hypothetical protein